MRRPLVAVVDPYALLTVRVPLLEKLSDEAGSMFFVVLNESGQAVPVVHIEGQQKSEIAGVAFTDDGQRMYFSSQRGQSAANRPGITYEVTGPFDEMGKLFGSLQSS